MAGFFRRHERQRIGLGRLVTLLWILVLLQFHVLAKANDKKATAEQQEDGGNHVVNVDTATEQQDEGDEWTQENGIFVFETVDEIPELVLEQPHHPVLLVLLVYAPSCSHSLDLVKQLESVAYNVSQYMQDYNEDEDLFPPPLFGKLDGSTLNGLPTLLGIDSYPSPLMVRSNQDEKADEDVSVVVMNYMGLPSEMYATVLHDWYRIRSVVRVDNLTTFLSQHGPGALRHVPPALPPSLSEREVAQAQWLLQDDKEDPYVIFMYCQYNHKYYKEFERMADMLVGRRNVLFVPFPDDCEEFFPNGFPKSGGIMALFVRPRKDWSEWREDIIHSRLYDPPQQSLEEFVVVASTPSVLWYDRQSVAPIAFPTYRKIHAVLFVDQQESQQQLQVKQFRRACRPFREDDMVCVVVPKTERRILTTFGVDIWTPLDNANGGPVPPVLPTLLITHQKAQGMQRYLLDAMSILSDPKAIYSFVEDFWDGKLTPLVQTSESPVSINKSGVQIWTAATFWDMVSQKGHSLVHFYAPTCGHCKRFQVVWNDLAKLFRELGWDTFVSVAKMDVTTNEVFGFDIQSVSTVYYIPKQGTPVRYTQVDEFGDGIGRLSDPMVVLEWFLDVADLDEELLLNQLRQDDDNEAEDE